MKTVFKNENGSKKLFSFFGCFWEGSPAPAGTPYLGLVGWQWLEEATALPRVGLFDGAECRGQLVSTTLIANPGHLQPYFWFGGPCFL